MKRLIPAMMVLMLAATGEAAEPQSTANTHSNEAGKNEPSHTNGVPDVSVNQAEINQYQPGLKNAQKDLGNLPASNPLMPQINRIEEVANARLADLKAQLDNQVDDVQALELIREIERVKQEVELDILRLQASAASARGDQETADAINAALDEMTSPRAPRPAVDRPAPASNRN